MGSQNPAQAEQRPVAALRVRVRPSIKAAAVRMAKEDGRSLTRWLEWLIEAEARRAGGKKQARERM
jgi:predicted HicB family RNase H-like nuclease